jgi:hypothetical protein
MGFIGIGTLSVRIGTYRVKPYRYAVLSLGSTEYRWVRV